MDFPLLCYYLCCLCYYQHWPIFSSSDYFEVEMKSLLILPLKACRREAWDGRFSVKLFTFSSLIFRVPPESSCNNTALGHHHPSFRLHLHHRLHLIIMILMFYCWYYQPVRYGKVFKSHLFGSPTIVSCDLELNMFVLQNEEKLFQASYPKPIHGILGKYSLLTVSGDLHRKLRNIGVSFIASSKSSPHFLHWIEKLSISMMDSWSGRNEVSFFKEAKAVR